MASRCFNPERIVRVRAIGQEIVRVIVWATAAIGQEIALAQATEPRAAVTAPRAPAIGPKAGVTARREQATAPKVAAIVRLRPIGLVDPLAAGATAH